MKLVKDKEINLESWKYLLLKNEYSSPFQTPEFYAYINTLPDITCNIFAVEDNGELQALCLVTVYRVSGLRGYFSRRGIIYGGLLISNVGSGTHYSSALLDCIYKNLRLKVIYIETYNFFDYNDYKDIFLSKGWLYKAHLNVQIPLSGKTIEQLKAEMKYNRRREINLSLKEGAIVREAQSIQEVTSLYEILADLYRTRVRLPLPSKLFFKGFFQNPIGKVFVVIHEGKVIGGSFCLFLTERAIYTFYYCGLRDCHKNIFPSHMAVYGAIEYGVKNNLKFVDLMGAGKPDEEYSVRDSKIRFGGNLIEQGRFLKICNPLLYLIGSSVLKLQKNLLYKKH